MIRQRCAIYTRKSTEEGLEQSFNSLDAQREACSAYITSQRHEGWSELADRYDDGGYSGGSMDRPGLERLLADIAAGRIDVVVVYKVDRLTRALSDFAKMVEIFDAAGVSFVSVTQAFNTTSSMGRLTLNVLLSFTQFEREVTAERILEAKGDVDGWRGSVRLSGGEQGPRRRARGGRLRSDDLRGVSGTRFGTRTAGAARYARHCEPASGGSPRQGHRRHSVLSGSALSPAQEPHICRQGAPRRHALRGDPRCNRGSEDVAPDTGATERAGRRPDRRPPRDRPPMSRRGPVRC